MSMNLGSILGGNVAAKAYEGMSFEPLPPGWYTAMIEGAEVRKTRAGDGHYLKLRFKLVGQHAGRVFFSQINIQNPSPKAEEIGRWELGGLAHACGMISVPGDESAFIDKVVEIRLVVAKNFNGEDDNEVKGYRPASGGAPIAQPARTPAQVISKTETTTTAAPATQGAMPWMRS